METLELKHLAPYLPYGLKGIYNETIITLSLNGYSSVDEIGYDISLFLSCKIKPILRPLSDLTKEIEVNGEKFVPLQKLCRMVAYNEQYRKEWKYSEKNEYVPNGTQFGTFEKELIYFSLATDVVMSREFGYLSSSKRFYLRNPRDNEDITYPVNQFLGLQKLFEWHFDVFGLIDKRLAVDINTLK